MANPKLEGLVVVPTGGWIVSVVEHTPNTGATNATIAAGDYYPTSTTSFLTALKTALDLVSANSTYTVTLDDTANSATGKVTISATGITTFDLTWTSTALQDALGFTGNTSGALTYTGTEQAEYLWLPGGTRSNPLGPDPTSTSTAFGVEEDDGFLTIAPGRVFKAIAGPARRGRERMEWAHQLGSRCHLNSETTVNASFQKFYRDVLFERRPFRYHPDRSSDTVYWTLRHVQPGMLLAPEFPGLVGATGLFHVGPYDVYDAS